MYKMVKEKPLRRRPPGRPKDVFIIGDKYGTIINISKSLSIALKQKPVDGSVAAITPGQLGSYFGNDPVVRKFLETYEEGRWSP